MSRLKHSFAWAASIFAATVLLATLILSPASYHATAAPPLAPELIPTPVSASASQAAANVITWMSASARTADGGGSAQNTRNFQRCDVSWAVDVGTVNTTTLTLQFSNDNTYWVNGAAIESTIVADSGLSTTGSGNMQQFAVFGRYSRVYADVTNSNPITVTAIGTCR